MNTNLLIPYALQNGCIIHVDHVPSGLACALHLPYVSPEAGRSHKGQVQAHHFQHEAGATACETQLHGTAKWMLYERIDAAIAKGEPLPVRWQCWKCPCIHEGDLLEDAKNVFPPEEPLPDSRIVPDLWLSADHGMTPCAFVEIVVTHEPEAGTKDYARERQSTNLGVPPERGRGSGKAEGHASASRRGLGPLLSLYPLPWVQPPTMLYEYA